MRPIKWIGGSFCALCLCMCVGAVLFGRLRLISSFEYLLTSPKVIDNGQDGLFTNGSFAEFEHERWMAVRKMEGKQSFIYLAKEEEGMLHSLTKLDLNSVHAEDPRLLVFRDQLLVVYNDFVGPFRRVHLAFLQKTPAGWGVEKKQLLST